MILTLTISKAFKGSIHINLQVQYLLQINTSAGNSPSSKYLTTKYHFNEIFI